MFGKPMQAIVPTTSEIPQIVNGPAKSFVPNIPKVVFPSIAPILPNAANTP